MLTRQEAERLAQSINALRPEWPVQSLLTFLAKRKERPYLDVALELTYVALDPDTKSPARIDVDGPWKRLRHDAKAGPSYRAVDPNTCIVCGDSRGWFLHGDKGDHAFENPLMKKPGVKPTPEQRAALDAAAAEARKLATAEREAKTKREAAPVDEVLARHQSEQDETEEKAS